MLKTRILSFGRRIIFEKRDKSTGDLMKDCGWDKLVVEANSTNEAEKKENEVEMRKSRDTQVGIAVEKIPVDGECEMECVKFLDGVPPAVAKNSHAIIRRRPKMVTQQGTDNVGVWELQFATTERWENPCMGWSSSGDPHSNLSLFFVNPEDAVEFAKKRGWSSEVDETPEKPRKHIPKSYAEIFSWNRRTRMSTK